MTDGSGRSEPFLLALYCVHRWTMKNSKSFIGGVVDRIGLLLVCAMLFVPLLFSVFPLILVIGSWPSSPEHRITIAALVLVAAAAATFAADTVTAAQRPNPA